MTCSLSQIQPSACQADSRCGRPPRFQARLEAADGTRRVHRNAGACADHLGDMIQALTGWARDHDLTDGELTVLTIDPPFAGVTTRRSGHRQPVSRTTLGLAFSTIPLTR